MGIVGNVDRLLMERWKIVRLQEMKKWKKEIIYGFFEMFTENVNFLRFPKVEAGATRSCCGLYDGAPKVGVA